MCDNSSKLTLFSLCYAQALIQSVAVSLAFTSVDKRNIA